MESALIEAIEIVPLRDAFKKLEPPDSWPHLQEEMIEAMIRLEHATRQRLAKIKL